MRRVVSALGEAIRAYVAHALQPELAAGDAAAIAFLHGWYSFTIQQVRLL